MSLLNIAASAVTIASFALGWFRGYKKACDAHLWDEEPPLVGGTACLKGYSRGPARRADQRRQ